MADGSVPRGVLNAPRMGPFRVPLDLIPIFFVLGLGIFTGMPLWVSGVLTVLAGIANASIRRLGNGFLRGFLLFRAASHLHLPGRDLSGKRTPPG